MHSAMHGSKICRGCEDPEAAGGVPDCDTLACHHHNVEDQGWSQEAEVLKCFA